MYNEITTKVSFSERDSDMTALARCVRGCDVIERRVRVTSSAVANHDNAHLSAEDDETVAGTAWTVFTPESHAGTGPETTRNYV